MEMYKRVYVKPETEVVELKMNQALLTQSNDPLAPQASEPEFDY